MEVVRGKKSDFGEIIKLWQRFFPEDKGPFVIDYLGKRLKNDEILVAREDGKAVGFLAFFKEYFSQSDYNQFIMVDESYQRKGVATRLMNEFERQANKRGCRRIYSSVEPWNRASIRMHKKLGYARCGYVDHIWNEGIRDLFYSKKLWKGPKNPRIRRSGPACYNN